MPHFLQVGLIGALSIEKRQKRNLVAFSERCLTCDETGHRPYTHLSLAPKHTCLETMLTSTQVCLAVPRDFL